MVQFPACLLTTPDKPECRKSTPLAGRNDAEKKTVTADAVAIPGTLNSPKSVTSMVGRASMAGGALVLAATPSPSGLSGDFKASPLSSATTWSTALNSGSFSWSYGMPVPNVPGDLKPDLSLAYSSGAIDGRTANSNNQASWVGDGFDLSPGFVERSYKPCGDEGVKTDGAEPGDLCWAYDNATISFAGHAGELIPTGTDEWRIKGDDNTKVVRLRDTARGNGDNDGEYFQATTTSGTRYYFGYNRLPNWGVGKTETNSVETVPVYGNNSGEPCNKATFADSWCQQGRRWNLDLVLDTNGNDITYWYKPEANSYGRNLKDTAGTAYVRATTLDHIDYGQQQGDIYSATVRPMARVDFTTGERCLEDDTTRCDPANIGTNRQYWYDVPWDQNCKVGSKCDQDRFSPTFWTRNRLAKVTTQTLQADGTYKPVDEWALHHKWGTADVDYQLLLDSIQHTALAGTTPVKLPTTSLSYTPRIGRLDKDGDGRLAYYKQRLSTVADESGGQLDVNYSQAACDWNHLPTPQTNTTHCFPQKYQPNNDVPMTTEWFNKYVVDSVIATDRTGGAPDMVTHYSYLDDGAWAFDDDDGITKEKLKTWSQWRGHAHVRVETGGDAAMSTQTDHYYLRGMNGDRTDPSDKTKTRNLSIPDGEGTTLTDDEAWTGVEYRTETYDKPGGKILSKVVNTPWKKETAKRVRDWGTTTANLTGVATARNFTSLDAGAGTNWRETRTNSTFDDRGRATQSESLGDIGTDKDDTCTRTTYADNTTAWLFTAPIHTETVAASCAATPNRDTRSDGSSVVLTDTRIRYDDQAYGATPTKGQATMTESLKSRSGNSATYLDDKATFDTYGRPLTTTALSSTSVFNPADETKAPVTTPAVDARTTTTAYTPPTGRPTAQTVTTPPATVGTAASAQTTTTYFDLLRGLPIVSTDPTGRRIEADYDALGRPLKVWKPNRSKVDSQSPNLEFRYSNDPNVIQSVASLTLNSDGSQDTAYTLYDGFGRVRQTQAPGQDGGRLLTDTFYDERGQAKLAYAPYYATGAPSTALFKVEDATGVETQTATQYDGLGRPTKTTLFAGDSQNTVLSTTTTQYGGDRVTVTPPLGATPTTTITDAAGHTTELRQYHANVPTGPAGPYDSTTYSYDPAGHLASLTDPAGSVWIWIYDQLGRQVKAVDPDSGTNTKAYNDRGEVTSTTDGRGKTITSVYDNLSRLLETHDGTAAGPLLTSQTWDPANNQGQQASSTRYATIGGKSYAYKTTANSYDALYRPTKTTVAVPSVPGQEGLAGNYVTTSSFNLDGTPKSATYPAAGGLAAETVAFTYDKLHRPISTSSNLSTYLTNQTYSLTGKPLQSTLNAGGKNTQITNGYEYGTQRLSSSRTDQDGITGAARSTAYTYDQAGNVTSMSDVSRSGTDRQCFQYDYLTRLTEAFTPTDATCPSTADGSKLGGVAPYWSSYTYNTDGTRRTETRHDPKGDTSKDSTRSYTYPANGAAQPHSLLSTSTLTGGGTGARVDESYAYDAAGNTTGRHLNSSPTAANDQTLTWNSEGRLGNVADIVKTKSGSSTFTTNKNTDYVYDTSGNRLTAHTLDTADPAAENTTLYFGSTELNFIKGAAKPKATRYYALGSATAVRTDDNKVTFQVTDHHGTADTSINAADGSLSQRRSTPFGEDRGTAPSAWAGTKGFIGGTKDTDTGLTHLGAREYDPETGRFISVDPILADQDPQSLNGYTYSNNNPLTLADPSGERPAGTCDGTAQCKSPDGVVIQDLWSYDTDKWTVKFKKSDETKAVLYGGVVVNKTKSYKKLQKKIAEGIRTYQRNGYKFGYDAAADAHQYVAAATNACFGDEECHSSDTYDEIDGKLKQWKFENVPMLGGEGEDFPSSVVGKGMGKEDARGEVERPKPGACNSFPAGTPVLLADGSLKPIEKLEVGDEVAAADPEDAKSGSRKVDATIVTPDDADFTTLTIEDAQGARSTLTATDHHPIWSPSVHAWLNAADLKPGMKLRSASGVDVEVVSTIHFKHRQAAYNLTVEDFHTYYVLAGATPVLVRNCNIPMDEAVNRAVANVGENATVVRSGSGGLQFMSVTTDQAGNVVRKIARFDVNPNSPHVQKLGPHLNLETQINGKTVTSRTLLGGVVGLPGCGLSAGRA
ncbi:polymorphic toxin-type HINT domain-containing protein, partial [Streptomyces mauvecolor]